MKEKLVSAWNFVRKHKKISIITTLGLIVITVVAVSLGGSSEGETKYVLASAQRGAISSSVSGSGTVTAESQVDIKPKVSGDVVYVGVKVGDKVSKGQLIALIDDTDAEKNVRDAELSLENAKLSYEKAIKSADDIDIAQAENALFKAEDTLDKEEISGYDTASGVLSDMAGVMSDIHGIIYDTDHMFGLGNFSYYKSLALINQVGAENALSVTNADYKTADAIYKETQSLVPFGNESDEIILSLQSVYDSVKVTSTVAQSARNFLMIIRDDMDDQGTTIPSFLTSAISSVETIISALNTDLSSLSTRKGAIRDAIIAVAEKEDALDELKEGPDELALSSAKISLSQKENSLEDAKEKLTDHYIRAPFDGTIAKMNIKNADSVSSDSVSSGSSIATIVANKSIAEISLSEVDVAKVKTGQKAILDFDAIDELTVTGTVVEVDAVGSSSQGVVSYGAKISFDIENDQIRSGMNVNATIIVETITDAVMVPLGSVKQQGETSYISVVENYSSELSSSPIPLDVSPQNVVVQTGLENDDYIQIISGVNEGDVVIARTVSNTTTSSTTQSTASVGGGGEVMFGGMSGPGMR